MKKNLVASIVLSISVFASPLVTHALPWANNAFVSHGNINIAVAGNYEPSGMAWNPVTNKLFTVCNTGQVTMMNLDGTAQENVRMPSYMDFEAITIADPNSSKVFIGLENRDSILEFDWATRSLTGMRWDLTSVMTGPDNAGLEGLTFVPNGYHPFPDSASGGVFYAAIQRAPVPGGVVTDDYLIYAFDIDLNTNGRIVNWWGIPVAANTPTSDISDLYFSQDTGVLYVLYDGANRLIEMTTAGAKITVDDVEKDYTNVPVADQEGVAIVTNYNSGTADIYLASDSAKSIGWFSGYPVSYYDFDGDGVDYIADCNDRDASVSVCQTYYSDVDGDGLGSDVETSVCASVPPAGFVLNSNDANDNDPANIVAYSEQNLVNDGDMESVDTTAWRNYGVPTVVEKRVDATKNPVSSQVMHISTNGGGVQQTNVPVVAGHTYELSYEAKVASGLLYVRLGNNDSNSDFQNAQQITGISPSYVTKTRRFVAPASANFRLVMAVRGGDVYIDNVSIVEVDPGNLLGDGNMSALSDGVWNKYSTQSKEKLWSEEKNGRIMHLSSIGSGAQQNYLNVQPGRRYILKFDYKTSGNGLLRPVLSTKKVESDFEGLFVNLRSEQGWSEYVREFTVPNDFVAGTTRFTLNFINRGGQVYIDNVTIIPILNGSNGYYFTRTMGRDCLW
ncbi:SdiA-regulated domain-containing protein [Candidatus Gracilibacteria bacterium]|nr:SdiA-regulated domain-containing protein [Candidatus Gracilibacteria bacterium]